MPRAIGLDIGSHAVRAAELRLGRPPELTAFGQVGLTRGAVSHGEVVDPGAVASALRRLWREARFRDRRVRVGLAGLRTIIRQVEMPAMADDELRSALEFQSGEFIPLPPEETLLDFEILERFESPDGDPMLRVLIAAIHRDALQNALTAVRESGLQAVAFDLAPFALIRALAPFPTTPVSSGEEEGAEEEGEEEAPAPTSAEAMVSVGSGVTIVAVHEAGVVRFVRIVDVGGDDFTDSIQRVLEVSFEDAELLKRQLGQPVDRGDEALAAVEAPVAALLNEVRGSIDFYTGQAGARRLERVLLTGGGALLDGFTERMADALGLPVDPADAGLSVLIRDLGFAPEQLPLLRPYLPVPVGLALGGDRAASYRINLLSERERRVLAPGRLIVVGAAAATMVVGSIALLTMQRNDELADARDQVARQQSTNQQLQATIGELQGARDLRTEADAARALLASIVQQEVSWPRVLQDLARVIPQDVWLDQFQGSGISAAAGADQAAATNLGSLTFAAIGADFPSAAAWLQRLLTLPSIENPWLGQISRSSVTVGGLTLDGISFSSNASLTDAARSERSRRLGGQAGTAPPAVPPDTSATSAPTGEQP